jgi:hypothetical protein
MKKIKLNLPVDDLKIVLPILMVSSFSLFDEPIILGVKNSLLHDVAKKMLNYQVNTKTIRLLKYHEAWVLYEILTNAYIEPHQVYTQTLVQRLIGELHQQLI